ncbi:MAG: mechanosensitive ion channel family protein [Candidatus Eisenbacteria bacterium]
MDLAGNERIWEPLAIVAAALIAGLVLRFVGRRWLATWAARTTTDLDDVVVRAMGRHLPWWPLFALVPLAARVAGWSPGVVLVMERAALGLFIVSASLVAANLLTEFVTRSVRTAGATIPTTSLARNVIRVAVLALGGLVLLSNLGMSITPLLTALGVGSLAVALALQPTLSNLFAGIHIVLARPIRVGDFIELENGRQGYVTDIGWRAIRIRELPNNLIIVPNARVAEMTLINFNMPEPEQAALVQVGVSYDSDLAKVERVTCAVAREVLQKVQGGVPGFDPFIRYHTFGDSSINFTVILRVKEFVDRHLVTHEFIKGLRARYVQEGIEIPFPQRVVHLPAGEVAKGDD